MASLLGGGRNPRLLRLRGALRALHRELLFRWAMRRFLRHPDAFLDPHHPAFRQLVYGWGNEGFSAMPEFLAGSIAAARVVNGPVLECGSGLSTILLGAIVGRRGGRLWSLEDSEEWAAKARRYIALYGLDSVVLSVAPLRSYGSFLWYEPPLESMPAQFSLVVCDGPTGTTPGGRYGLVPVMREHFAPGCVILLDDGQRPEEPRIASSWVSELGGSFELVGHLKPYIRVTLPPPHSAAP